MTNLYLQIVPAAWARAGGGQHTAVQPDPVQSETSPPKAAPPAEPEAAEQTCEPPTQEQRAELVWACDGRYDCIRDVNNFVASFGQPSFIDPLQLGQDLAFESFALGLGVLTWGGRLVLDGHTFVQTFRTSGDERSINGGNAALSVLIGRATRGASEGVQRFGAAHSNLVGHGGDAVLHAVREFEKKNCRARSRDDK